MKKAVLNAVCMLASFFIAIIYIKYDLNNKSENTVVPTFTEVVYKEEGLRESIDKIYNSVFVIETYDKNGNKLGTGSGFCYKKDKNGYLITNNHVIENGSIIKVINMNEESFEAKLLGSDDYLDIAILKVDENAVLSVANLGSSMNTSLGDTVFTVGSPLGSKYMGTVTKGIVSGKNRKVNVTTKNGDYIMEVLQTDAAINPGNSGGPLVNLNGEVIGVNSLKLVQDEIEGMGFAIPIELVKESLAKLETGEIIIRPVLGIEITNINFNRYDIPNGIIITNVENNYPAFKAGLKAGDVLLSINDEVIDDIAHFRYVLYKYSINDTIRIKYMRNGHTYEVNVLLDKSI